MADRKRVEMAILEKAKEGKIPCAVCFKIAEDFGITKRGNGRDSERDEDQNRPVPAGLF